MVKQGAVTVNGRTAVLGDSADPDVDVILVDGKPLPAQQQFVYLMLNKPRGYVTTLSDEKGRKNAAQLVADCGVRVYPVGRLDMDSEGLLLFTNDGEFANNLMHPRHEVNKIYRVTVDGYSDPALERLRRPVTLDGYTIAKPEADLLEGPDITGRAVLQVMIHEGRNRQVRRMCAMAGMNVLRLVRIAEGNLRLGALKCGAWRYLTEEEIAGLK
jgi:23S rRNA pseudouridine2605 synthase